MRLSIDLSANASNSGGIYDGTLWRSARLASRTEGSTAWAA